MTKKIENGQEGDTTTPPISGIYKSFSCCCWRENVYIGVTEVESYEDFISEPLDIDKDGFGGVQWPESSSPLGRGAPKRVGLSGVWLGGSALAYFYPWDIRNPTVFGMPEV